MRLKVPRHAVLRFTGITLAAVLVGIFAGSALVTLTQLPQVEALETYKPKGVTTLVDIRGRVLHEFFRERRVPLPFETIPVRIRKTFLAAEDWRFYDHFGLDLRGLLRAFVRNVWERRYAEGASTITQQLSKVLFLTSEKTLARKFKEALLAIQIERRYGKNEILGLYLNQIYLGEGCYGIEAAARMYFKKTISELNVAETAMLAGLPKAPTIFSPFKNPARARVRRNAILKAMYERRLISQEEWREATEEPLPSIPLNKDCIDTYFAAHVLGLLSQEIGEDRIFRGHLRVQTTLDLDLQRAAEAAVTRGLEAYAKRHNIDPGKTEKLPQAALLAIDVRSGEIRALVGGRSFRESQFNRAIQAQRQPGSSFKPVLYTAALERGFNQSSLFWDEPISFKNRETGTWKPKNYNEDYDGLIPMRVALEKSKNVVAVRLLKSIGVPALKQMATRLGIASPIASNLSSALGSSSVTLGDLARAYATIANGGIRPNLRAVRTVTSDGNVNLWPPPPPAQPVLDPRIAYLMTDMLTGVIRFGTGRFAGDLPCALAGKTGTTNDNVDSLFTGFSTNTVAIAWMGFDDRASLGVGETGARAAGRIWKHFMDHVCETAGTEFIPPDGVILVDVDHATGKLPGRYSTDVVSEAFLPGSEPVEISPEGEISQL